MSKHTAGPWLITGNMTKYVEARLGNGWVQEVCAVGPTEADNGYGETQAANARLIAAAPDLLEALQQILADMDSEFGTGYDYNKALRAVIARATGETA